MGTNMLWKYILKDQNESNVTYLVLLLDNNNCEKKAMIMYKWYFELPFICIHTNNINYDLIQLKKKNLDNCIIRKSRKSNNYRET